MHFSARTERLILFFIALLLIFLSYQLYARMRDLINSYQLVNHTNIVQLKLEQIFSNTKDAETAQRGFLITHDSDFLKPFNGAYQRVNKLHSELEQLTSDNEKQQSNLSKLKNLLDYRFRHLNETLQISSITQDKKALKIQLTRGRVVMDGIRRHMNVMLNLEAGLLEKREKDKNRYVFLTPLFVLFLIILSIAGLIFSFYQISYQFKTSIRYSTQLSEKNYELSLKNRQLERSNEEQLSFNFIASHDLREPLRKIRTFSSLIVKDEDLPMHLKLYVERLNSLAMFMQSLLDDLYTYSRMSLSERKMDEVDLNKLVHQVENDMKDQIEETRATLEYSHLPVIKGIRFQLQQLFENLISNSIKFRQHGVPPRITITSEIISGSELPENFLTIQSFFVKLNFSDNGIGFDQKYADKIFGLFQRLHTKNEYGGTGIGLTICKKIVENHDGLITVTSEENKGTVFQVFLPVQVAEQEWTGSRKEKESSEWQVASSRE